MLLRILAFQGLVEAKGSRQTRRSRKQAWPPKEALAPSSNFMTDTPMGSFFSATPCWVRLNLGDGESSCFWQVQHYAPTAGMLSQIARLRTPAFKQSRESKTGSMEKQAPADPAAEAGRHERALPHSFMTLTVNVAGTWTTSTVCYTRHRWNPPANQCQGCYACRLGPCP